MRSSEFIDQFIARAEAAAHKAERVMAEVAGERFNSKPPNWHWSIAQIFQHMVKANDYYLPILEDAARAVEGDVEVARTWFGKWLSKMAGPGPNPPVPGPLKVGDGPFGEEVVDRFIQQCHAATDLARSVRTKDIGSVRFKNPFLPLFAQNLADSFEIMAQHNDRHVGQVEALAAGKQP